MCLSSRLFEAALSGCWRESDVQTAYIGDLGQKLSKPQDGNSHTYNGARNLSRGPIRCVMEMPTESPQIITDMLSFLYPHLDLHLHAGNLLPLTILADKIDLPRLSAACGQYASEQARSQPIQILPWALHCKDVAVLQACSATILKSFESYRQDPEYAKLPNKVQLLVSLLYSRSGLSSKLSSILLLHLTLCRLWCR